MIGPLLWLIESIQNLLSLFLGPTSTKPVPVCMNIDVKHAIMLSIQNLLFFYSVIFIHRLDIIRSEYCIWLQFLSAAVLPNIIKIGQNLSK